MIFDHLIAQAVTCGIEIKLFRRFRYLHQDRLAVTDKFRVIDVITDTPKFDRYNTVCIWFKWNDVVFRVVGKDSPSVKNRFVVGYEPALLKNLVIIAGIHLSPRFPLF